MGIVGVAAGYAISSTFVEPLYAWLTARALGTSPLALARGLHGVFLAAALMAAGVLAAKVAFLPADLHAAWQFVLLVVLGIALYVPLRLARTRGPRRAQGHPPLARGEGAPRRGGPERMRRALESAVRRHAPAAVRPALRRGKRAVHRTRYRVRRLVGASVDRSELAAGLETAGLSRGEAVFIHSALSGLGHVEGGPAAVVGAFEDVLGPDGLVAMPAFPLVGGSAEYLSTDPVDVRSTPSRMGAVTEHFRRLPGRPAKPPPHSLRVRPRPRRRGARARARRRLDSVR